MLQRMKVGFEDHMEGGGGSWRDNTAAILANKVVHFCHILSLQQTRFSFEDSMEGGGGRGEGGMGGWRGNKKHHHLHR